MSSFTKGFKRFSVMERLLQKNIFLAYFISFLKALKFFVWGLHIRLWWCRLFGRRNELHSSLIMDAEAMFFMDEEESDKYTKELNRRRNIAHERDFLNLPSWKRWV